jgi:hypothetical protein
MSVITVKLYLYILVKIYLVESNVMWGVSTAKFCFFGVYQTARKFLNTFLTKLGGTKMVKTLPSIH